MVKLCEKANETYAVLNLNMKGILEIKGRRLLGVAGQTIDSLLTRPERRR